MIKPTKGGQGTAKMSSENNADKTRKPKKKPNKTQAARITDKKGNSFD